MAFDKVIDSAQLNGALAATANKIREKSGETGSIPWDANTGFASAIGSLEVGGGGGDVDALLTGSITEFESNSLTTIRKAVFYYCESLTTVDLPALTSISELAFAYCTSLANLNVPLATEIGRQAFLNCTMSNFNLPKVATIAENAFQSCINIVSITLPSVTSIGNRAFTNCTALKNLTLPGSTVCTLGGTSVFQSCSALANIYVPSSLVDTYKSATNWSSHASKIKAIT